MRGRDRVDTGTVQIKKHSSSVEQTYERSHRSARVSGGPFIVREAGGGGVMRVLRLSTFFFP
jgi:hypothetical protein